MRKGAICILQVDNPIVWGCPHRPHILELDEPAFTIDSIHSSEKNKLRKFLVCFGSVSFKIDVNIYLCYFPVIFCQIVYFLFINKLDSVRLSVKKLTESPMLTRQIVRIRIHRYPVTLCFWSFSQFVTHLTILVKNRCVRNYENTKTTSHLHLSIGLCQCWNANVY